jgi:hypothetical protein
MAKKEEKNKFGTSKKDFMRGARDKKFSGWLWEMTKDVEPLAEKDLPHVWYSLDGDILHARTKLVEDKHEYSKWINHTLTIEYAEASSPDEHLTPVGFELWGFSSMTSRMLDWAYDFLSKHGVPIHVDLESKIDDELKTAKSRLTAHQKGRMLHGGGDEDAKRTPKART